ncbi:MAG: C25 family cysteine peptidase, partial [Flammeovirgaceae bacterium]|nr:C25 family cysteine peptidase [Flammeovirgaceae bacterium]
MANKSHLHKAGFGYEYRMEGPCMKHFFTSIILCLVTFLTNAQVGNEWIQFNQQYFKIPIVKDGLYRLTHANLQAAGFPVGTADPRRIQLFHRGEEVSIYVEGESDAVFNTSDFIEFYGRKNDGTLDSSLYKPASAQPHPYYNLFSDSTFYFLTYNPLPVLGKRMDFFSEVNVDNLPKETFQYQERLLVLSNQYSTGYAVQNVIQNTFFDQGEGWTGTNLAQGQSIDYTISGITDINSVAALPNLEIMLVGRISSPHQAQISVGPDAGSLRVLSTLNFNNYQTPVYTQFLTWTDISASGNLVVRINAQGVSGLADRLSASYVKLTFPQQVKVNSAAEKVLYLAPNGNNKSYIEIESPAAASRLYDVTDPYNLTLIGTTLTTTLNAVVPNTTSSRKLFVTNLASTPAIKKVSFRNINPEDHDFIIVSNRALMKPALDYNDVVKEYATYRASMAGGSYDTLIVSINQLFDQFSYGETTPLAIYNFMKFFTSQHIPKYLFLIGRGLDVNQGYYRNPGAAKFSIFKDYVPSAGMPGSDMAFTAGLNGTTYEPAVPTGRLTATNANEVANYLNKIIEHEARPFDGLNRKDILHLSGGINEGEPELFRSYLQEVGAFAEGYYLGGNVTPIAKQSTDIQLINVAEQVNKGLNMITFLGHSAPDATDFQIGYVTDPVLGYNNPGKYPVLLMNGCNVGAFFFAGSQPLFGEDWVNAANKGAIAFMAHSSFGIVFNLKFYSQIFYQTGFGDSLFMQQGIGDVQKETAKRFLDSTTNSIV